MSLSNYDNMRYKGTRTGSRATIQAAICNSANWEGDEATPYDLSPLGASFSTNFILPVELTAFNTQTTEGGKTHLTWATGNEINSHSFDIERSQDGKIFTPIGNVKAQGKAANYSFVDNTPLSNTSYYRLKSIDNDQAFAYSKVISIENKGTKGKLAVYPNPVSNLLNIENTEGGNFEIINLLGQPIKNGKAPFGGWGLDVSALPQGTYFLKMGAEQVKFIKQ